MQNYYTIISSFFSHCTFWTVFSLEPFCYYYRAYVLLPISMILILPYQCSYVELLVTFLPIAKHHVFVASLFGNQMENILLSVYAENGEYIMLRTATHRNVSRVWLSECIIWLIYITPQKFYNCIKWRMHVVEAHCYSLQCRQIDCEQICSTINQQLIAVARKI